MRALWRTVTVVGVFCPGLLLPDSHVRAQPATLDLKPGEIQPIGRHPKRTIKEGKKNLRYYVLDSGKDLRLRIGGPTSVVLLARGFEKGKISFALDLDGKQKGEAGLEVVRRVSRAIYFEVPQGTHQLTVVPSTKVMVRPRKVRRRAKPGDLVVAWKEAVPPPAPVEEEDTATDTPPPALVEEEDTATDTPPLALVEAEDTATDTPPPAPVEAEDTATEPPPPALAEEEGTPKTTPPPAPPGEMAGAAREKIVEPPLEEEKTPYLGVGLLLDLMITAGKPSGTSLGSGETFPSGNHGVGVPLLVSVKGYIPAGQMLVISPGLEVGWYRLWGDGGMDLPNDPDFGNFSYSWIIDSLPLFAGVSFMLRPVQDIPLYLAVGGGLAVLYAWAQSTYEKEGQEPVTDAVQSDWGVGYFLGVEAAYGLGPGRITLEYRYSSARTDLQFGDIYDGGYNQQPGDLQGSNIMLGYRLDIPW